MLTSQREPLRTRSQALYLQMSVDSGNQVFGKIVSTPKCDIEAQNISKHLFAKIMACVPPFVNKTILNKRSKLHCSLATRF